MGPAWHLPATSRAALLDPVVARRHNECENYLATSFVTDAGLLLGGPVQSLCVPSA